MPHRSRSFLGNFIIWLVIGSVVMAVFRYLGTENRAASLPPPTVAYVPPPPACGPLPPSGTTTVFDFPAMHRPDAPQGILGMKNEQRVSLVALLLDTQSRPLQAITLSPGDMAQVKVPAGQFGLRVMTGSNWCNLDIGFIGGTRHQITGGVSVIPDGRIHAILKPSLVSGDIDISYHIPRLPPKPPVIQQISRGGLEIQRGAGGVLITRGTINQVPVNMVIDTGASGLSIASWMAQHAGIHSCTRRSMHSTANGIVAGCKSTVANLTFGPFHLTNVEVNILPNMAGEALLGMDVLRQFNMVWAGDRVRISAPGSANPEPSPPLSDPSLDLPTAAIVPWPTVQVMLPPPQQPMGAVPQPPSMDMMEVLRMRLRIWVMQYPPEVARPFVAVVLYLIVVSPLVAGIYIWQRRKRTKPMQQQVRSHNRRDSKGAEYYNPKEFRADRSAAAPPRSSVVYTPQSRLLTACGGDKARMERLMEYESRKAPFISDAEAAKRALERLERDRN